MRNKFRIWTIYNKTKRILTDSDFFLYGVAKKKKKLHLNVLTSQFCIWYEVIGLHAIQV